MTRRRMIFGAVVSGAVVTAALVAQLGLGGSGKVQIGSGAVSALARASGPADTLPASILEYPFADRNFASSAGKGARLLKRDGSLNLYALPGKGALVCLIEVDTAADTAGGACADRSVLRTGPIYMADRQEDGTYIVTGLVGDGHTYAEAGGKRTNVQSNAFVLRDVRTSELTVGSPNAAQTVDIGD